MTSSEQPEQRRDENEVEPVEETPAEDAASTTDEVASAQSEDGSAPEGEAQQRSAAEALAEEALRAAKEAAGDDARPLDLPGLEAAAGQGDARGIDLLSDVNLHVKIELGRTHMYVEDVLQLGEGAVVELDKLAGDPVDVYVNGRHVARGEVLVLSDNFCVRINEIIAENGHAGDKKKRSA